MPRLILTVLALFAAIAGPRAADAQPAELRLDTTWLLDANAVHPGGTIHGALHVKMPGRFHVQSNKPADEMMIPTALSLTAPPGLVVREIVYPKAVETNVEGFDEPLLVFDHEFVIGIALEAEPDLAPGSHQLAATLKYQACNDQICLAPASLKLTTEIKVVAAAEQIQRTSDPRLEQIQFSSDPVAPVAPDGNGAELPTQAPTHREDCDVLAELDGFSLRGATGGYLGPDKFIAFVDGAEQGTLKRSYFEDLGPIAIVLAVIIGGVLLNLTPCVLPLIPINLAIIGAGAQAGSRARGFALGGVYGLAMAFVYGVLGLIVTLTATSFGEINSTIWFNVAIAALFVVLALAMFDVIAIDFTKYQTKLDASKLARHGAVAMAFGMGCVTALLAGACVAPVVIQVVVYAGDQYAKGSTIALALPFALGLGMALPWPFAGAGLSFLPKPGMWMVRVKQAMGLFILAFAAYYGYLAWEIWDSKRVDAAAVQHAVNEQLEGGWTPSLCVGLAQARAENKPILIDMWATWCKNCLAMDKTTFKDPAVIERLDGYVKVKFQAEDLSESPARELLERFEGIGLPTYAILQPNEPAAQR